MGKACTLSVTQEGPEVKKGRIINNSHITQKAVQRVQSGREFGLRVLITTNLHVQHSFLYISFPSLHNYDVKLPNFTIIEKLRKRRRISLSLFELGFLFRDSTPGEFAHIWKSKRVKIIAMNGFNEREFTS